MAMPFLLLIVALVYNYSLDGMTKQAIQSGSEFGMWYVGRHRELPSDAVMKDRFSTMGAGWKLTCPDATHDQKGKRCALDPDSEFLPDDSLGLRGGLSGILPGTTQLTAESASQPRWYRNTINTDPMKFAIFVDMNTWTHDDLEGEYWKVILGIAENELTGAGDLFSGILNGIGGLFD